MLELFAAFVLGTGLLLRQSYTDIVSRLVNSRWNWVAFGFLMALALRAGFIVEALGTSLVFYGVFSVLNRGEAWFGDGDKEILAFLFPAMLLIGGLYQIVIFSVLMLLFLLWVLPWVKRLTKVRHQPLVPYILTAWIITSAIFFPIL